MWSQNVQKSTPRPTLEIFSIPNHIKKPRPTHWKPQNSPKTSKLYTNQPQKIAKFGWAIYIYLIAFTQQTSVISLHLNIKNMLELAIKKMLSNALINVSHGRLELELRSSSVAPLLSRSVTRSLGRSVAGSLGRSVARLLDRSVARRVSDKPCLVETTWHEAMPWSTIDGKRS